jgi:hypothetical protein
MSRKTSILLNKAIKVLKTLDYKYANITMNYSNVDILFPGTSCIGHSWTAVFEYFKKEKINWMLRVENQNFILTIKL